ncbi:MAG: hypothetical protein M1827_001361 [Pycnora praestabilis]|nr:MAG: hypothetical protein M1827_001361 [Pycnora praestabilis]
MSYEEPFPDRGKFSDQDDEYHEHSSIKPRPKPKPFPRPPPGQTDTSTSTPRFAQTEFARAPAEDFYSSTREGNSSMEDTNERPGQRSDIHGWNADPGYLRNQQANPWVIPRQQSSAYSLSDNSGSGSYVSEEGFNEYTTVSSEQEWKWNPEYQQEYRMIRTFDGDLVYEWRNGSEPSQPRNPRSQIGVTSTGSTSFSNHQWSERTTAGQPTQGRDGTRRRERGRREVDYAGPEEL